MRYHFDQFLRTIPSRVTNGYKHDVDLCRYKIKVINETSILAFYKSIIIIYLNIF